MPLESIDAVPLPNHTIFMLEPKHADRSCFQSKTPPTRRHQLKPHGCEHAREVTMRKQQHIPGRCKAAFDHAFSTSSNRINALAPGAAHTPEVPSGTPRGDLC